jgi:hypothetical protein
MMAKLTSQGRTTVTALEYDRDVMCQKLNDQAKPSCSDANLNSQCGPTRSEIEAQKPMGRGHLGNLKDEVSDLIWLRKSHKVQVVLDWHPSLMSHTHHPQPRKGRYRENLLSTSERH